MLSWLVGGAASKNASTQSLSALDEPAALEQALKAMALVMNDDVSGAELALEDGTSTFHKLGRSVTAFLRATLGFEPDVMREASEILGDAEACADRDRKRAQKEQHRHTSYPPGTEFALCHAEAQLMSAVVGVLSESLVDAMKAFYKLRRAYLILEEIQKTAPKKRKTVVDNEKEKKKKKERGDDSSIDGIEDDESVEDEESEEDEEQEEDQEETYPSLDRILSRESIMTTISMSTMEPMDVFIHSGSNLCFGLLLLILSLIPPSLGRLLSIIGFKGDRDLGLKMLWQASKADNVHGAISTLALLNFYGMTAQFCDIMPEDDGTEGGYPMQRCHNVLSLMRRRYPDSALWLLEEARMEAINGHLQKAIDLLDYKETPQMRQVEALMVFERAINSMFLHRHQEVADSFLKLIELNNWSHALYYYFVAVSYVELYRETLEMDPEKAEKYAQKAEAFLEITPSFVGKKRFMAQNLPLETFADRKIKKWQARAREMNVRLIEAVGVSPGEEMMYFWNGYKRMDDHDFAKSLIALEWKKERLKDEPADEQAIHSLLTGVLLRNMGDMDKAREHLQEVMSIDKWSIKGGLKDDWTIPTAHYEWAVIIWAESGPKEAADCQQWLLKAAKWETYELDTRVGLRVTSALETVNKFVQPA